MCECVHIYSYVSQSTLDCVVISMFLITLCGADEENVSATLMHMHTLVVFEMINDHLEARCVKHADSTLSSLEVQSVDQLL